MDSDDHPRCLLTSCSRLPPQGGNTSGPAKPVPRCSPNGPRCARRGGQREGEQEISMTANIRKLVVQIDETRKEMGKTIEPPTRRAVAIAVIENPYAGRYSESLDELIAIGEELGALLG